MTELFDCAAAWDQLPSETQRELGAAAVLNALSMAAQDAAEERGDYRRARILEIAIGVSAEAISTAFDKSIEVDLDVVLPDLRPFGIDQCQGCGCIEEVACKGGCSWAEKDLCSACVPVMAESAEA